MLFNDKFCLLLCIVKKKLKKNYWVVSPILMTSSYIFLINLLKKSWCTQKFRGKSIGNGEVMEGAESVLMTVLIGLILVREKCHQNYLSAVLITAGWVFVSVLVVFINVRNCRLAIRPCILQPLLFRYLVSISYNQKRLWNRNYYLP